jgi:ferritin-like metal-binding protein YciE
VSGLTENNLNRDKLDNDKFAEYLNEILSAENAVVERLNKRIQETQFKESKKTLQQDLQEEINHQSRLKDLISEYGGTPTNSKAELLSLNSSAAGQTTTIDITDNNLVNDSKIRSTLEGSGYNITSMNVKNSQLQSEILRTEEDAMIKNAEILGYKIVLKMSEKINATKATSILKKSIEEKESTSNRLIDSISKMINNSTDDYNGNKKNEQHRDPFQIGSAISDILTSYWSSKQNPSKVYIFNRRVHHGAIGALLGLSALYKNQPMITGILSGLGAGLAKDDYNDVKDWFLFKKKGEEQIK